jgi:hypothetical protein
MHNFTSEIGIPMSKLNVGSNEAEQTSILTFLSTSYQGQVHSRRAESHISSLICIWKPPTGLTFLCNRLLSDYIKVKIIELCLSTVLH